jgi:outer membrane protein OmpA-like peptidoglycan-associated protein
MKKVLFGLIGCTLVVFAMNTSGQVRPHSVISRDTALAPTRGDTTVQIKDSVISLADDAPISPATGAPANADPAKPAETAKADPAKADPAKSDAGKGDAGKSDAAKTDVSKTDATRTDAGKTDPATTDAAKADAAKADAGKSDTRPTVVVKSDGPSNVVLKTNSPDPAKAAMEKSDSADAAKNNNATQPQTDATAQAAKPKASADTTQEERDEQSKRELDHRWFIAPLTKFQFQDFAFLEKNRKGYLSDATSLPFFQRGNASFAASAYKNITNRLSFSADLGLSFGHATSNDVLISQTPSKTYNLINAALYYHLIGPSYRLQPYVTIGFNDIVNDKSYPTVPMGIGAKFNSKKVMVLGQVMYGQSISKSVASTTMYSVGIYIPIKSKKQKQLDDEKSNLNKKDKDKDEAQKKDSTNKGTGNVTNNIYITINMDSILKAKGLLDENGNPYTAGNGRRGGDDGGDDATSVRNRRKKAFRNIGLDDFDENDYKIDSMDGKPVVRFVVYFEFNDYGLNSKAFGGIDKVIRHLRSSSEFSVEIKGYTDSVGTDQYNNHLSRLRAKMVLDYMNSRGIPADLMKAKAYGSDSPVADNSDPNQAWLNRRAEIIIHKKELAAQ